MTSTAEALAEAIHREQRLADGSPYLTHLHAVSEIAVELYREASRPGPESTEEEAQIRQVALLHDAMEDHPAALSPEILREKGFHPRVIDALRRMTHRKDEPYEDYVVALRENPLAAIVKRADTTHNALLPRAVAPLRSGKPLRKILGNARKHLLTHLFLANAINETTYREEMAQLRAAGEMR